MTQLQYLFLDNNHLTGSIPEELSSLGNLAILSLSGNQLAGPLPDPSAFKPFIDQLAPVNSDFRYNALFTEETDLRDSMNIAQIGNDWESFQTVAPTDPAALTLTGEAVRISWLPIVYTVDPGTYEVEISTAEAGPYDSADLSIADKTVDNAVVDGLTAGTEYWFRVRTVTYAHSNNQNDVYSEYTDPISAIPGGPIVDTDGDGLTDDVDPDDDNDGMTDVYEIANGLDPLISDGGNDPDNDGWPSLAEFQDNEKLANDDTSHPDATEFFVGGAGADDNNLGDSDNPLATLHGAVARINALGEADYTIQLGGGLFDLAAEPDAPLAPVHNVTINGSGATLDGAGATAWTAGLTMAGGPVNVWIQGVTIRNFDQGIAVNLDGGCIVFHATTITGCGVGLQLAESYLVDVDLNDTVINSCETGIKVAANTSNSRVMHGTVRE